MSAIAIDDRLGGNGTNRAGMLLFLFGVAATIPIFWTGLGFLLDAWSTAEYSHGPLIPIVSAYLFLRDMRQVPPTTQAVRDRWIGVAVILFALLVAMLGNIARIPIIETYALVIWIWGAVLVSFGFRRGWRLWPGVLHLIFMIPLPGFLFYKISISLQLISSEIGVAVIRLLDIPVLLDGNIIDLGVYKLHVAEACSGLRYLFPILSFSYIFSLLYRGPLWHKAVLLLMAVPITVLMNSFRIGMIGVLVNQYGISHAEGFLHAFEGWVIFGSCVAILFLLAVLMQRLSPNPQPLADTIDLDFSHVFPQALRVRHHVPSAGLLTVSVAAAVLSAFVLFSPEKEDVVLDRRSFAEFPVRIDDWHGQRQALDARIERALGADDYYGAAYVSPAEPAAVQFFVAYYDNMIDGTGIHSPEICLPGSGWEMSRIQQRTIGLDTPQGERFVPVNRAIIQKGLHRQLVYYWFQQSGRQVASDYAAKLYAIYDSAVIGRTDGSLVRVMTAIRPGESDGEAEARLQRFLALVEPRLSDYLPDRNARPRTVADAR